MTVTVWPGKNSEAVPVPIRHQLMTFRSQVRKVLPEALTIKYEGGKKSFEDLSEEIHNEEELRKLMEESAERAIRYAEEQERIQREQQKRQQQQRGAL